jgi:GMP synthase-like glutamine amidotransferase
MILLISTNQHKLHELEFVKPIERIVKKYSKEKILIKHYFKLANQDLKNSRKVIICGTSLQDNKFLENISNFNWLKNYEKSVLGICSGMQIICKIFGSKLKNKTEIGFYKEFFEKNFLGLDGEQEVYHLHNNYFNLPRNFIQYNKSKILQAIKHNKKEIYGILFHPEVRQEKIIKKFLNC